MLNMKFKIYWVMLCWSDIYIVNNNKGKPGRGITEYLIKLTYVLFFSNHTKILFIRVLRFLVFYQCSPIKFSRNFFLIVTSSLYKLTLSKMLYLFSFRKITLKSILKYDWLRDAWKDRRVYSSTYVFISCIVQPVTYLILFFSTFKMTALYLECPIWTLIYHS